MNSESLIKGLIDQTNKIITKANQLDQLELNQLKWREQEDKWNILECIEHLNLYGDYYLPIFSQKIKESSSSPDENFKSGWLGNYFAKSMMPKEKLNKMKTFKEKNPINSQLDKSVLERFQNQQNQLLQLLQASEKVSLNKVKIPISIATFIKINLGDTFQFYINHMERHMAQIDGILKLRFVST